MARHGLLLAWFGVCSVLRVVLQRRSWSEDCCSCSAGLSAAPCSAARFMAAAVGVCAVACARDSACVHELSMNNGPSSGSMGKDGGRTRKTRVEREKEPGRREEGGDGSWDARGVTQKRSGFSFCARMR